MPYHTWANSSPISDSSRGPTLSDAIITEQAYSQVCQEVDTTSWLTPVDALHCLDYERTRLDSIQALEPPRHNLDFTKQSRSAILAESDR